MNTNILSDFLLKCVPTDARLMFNDALNAIIYFRMGEGYDQIVSLLAMGNDPYPTYFKDDVIELMNQCLMDIAHDHGIIAANHHFPTLVKLVVSLQHLIEATDPDVIEDALVAWEDNPKTCYQVVLEAHGGLADIDFHEIVLMIAISAVDKLRVLGQEVRNKLDMEIENAIADETTPDPEAAHKRDLLRKMNGQQPRPDLILAHITDKFLDIGHPIEELIEDVQQEFEALMPGAPEIAAVNVLALTLLGSGLVANITIDAKKMTERFYQSLGDIARVNEQIDIHTLG